MSCGCREGPHRQYRVTPSRSRDLKSELSHAGPKSGCRRAGSFWRIQGRICSCLFQLLETPHPGLVVLPPSSKPLVQPLPSLSYEDPRGDVGSSWGTQDHVPSQDLPLARNLQSPLCHGRSHIHRFGGLGRGRLWEGALFYPPHCRLLKRGTLDFPGGPVVKTPHSQCRGRGFDPWSGN